MNYDRLRLADVVVADPKIQVIDDQRERLGYVLVRCPHDDGTADHALHVHNPTGELSAHAYCLSESCRDVTTTDFMVMLGVWGWS